jgi:hypothetical protein
VVIYNYVYVVVFVCIVVPLYTAVSISKSHLNKAVCVVCPDSCNDDMEGA